MVTKNSKRAYLTPKTDLKVLLDKSLRSTKIKNNLFYPQDSEPWNNSFEFDDRKLLTEKAQDNDGEVSQHRKISVKDSNVNFQDIQKSSIQLEPNMNTNKTKFSQKNINSKTYKTGLKSSTHDICDKTERDSISGIKPADNSVFREIKENFLNEKKNFVYNNIHLNTKATRVNYMNASPLKNPADSIIYNGINKTEDSNFDDKNTKKIQKKTVDLDDKVIYTKYHKKSFGPTDPYTSKQ